MFFVVWGLPKGSRGVIPSVPESRSVSMVVGAVRCLCRVASGRGRGVCGLQWTAGVDAGGTHPCKAET
eukprot:6473352-Amphidinium_carterae.1